MNNYVKEIKAIIAKNGEIDMMNYEMDLVFHNLFGSELSNYNYSKIAELGCIKLRNGNEIVNLLPIGVMIEQKGMGDESDLVVVDYEDLSENLLLTILMYLCSIL